MFDWLKKDPVSLAERWASMCVAVLQDDKWEQLRTACPADWSPNRQNLDTKMAELQQTLKNLSEDVGGPLIPDSLAWVSE